MFHLVYLLIVSRIHLVRSELSFIIAESDIYWVVVQRVSLTSWGEGASLALVGNPLSEGVTIKIPYEVDGLLHRPALHPIFSYWAG